MALLTADDPAGGLNRRSSLAKGDTQPGRRSTSEKCPAVITTRTVN
jgi:hypothetical protein